MNYQVSDTDPATWLRGRTVSGVVIEVQGRDGLRLEYPDSTHDGKRIVLLADTRPDLAAQIAELRQAEADAADLRVRSLPGLGKLEAAQDAAEDERDRYQSGMHRMMDDEHNDGARPPQPIDESLAANARQLAAQYPRAALYLRARRQAESTHWADNTGKGAAGRQAMEILATGGSIEDAQVAMAKRRELTD